MEKRRESDRKVRSIIINALRVMLFLIMAYSLVYERPVVLATSIMAFLITFAPLIIKRLFKKEFSASFDLVIMISIFALLSFWEIWGIYTRARVLAITMNFLQAIVIGLLGLTVVYAFFKKGKMEHNLLTLSIFSFCLSFTIGAFLEIAEVIIDMAFNFRIHQAGIYGTTGDLAFYAFGSLIVSFAGYHSLKRGKNFFISTCVEKLVEMNPKIFGINEVDHSEHAKSLIEKGESNQVEFKSTLRKNLHTNALDKNIEHAVLKTINAYMNTSGGTLLIGVNDKKDILGLENDEFNNHDAVQRHLMQLINDYLGPENLKLVEPVIVPLGDKHILKVDCKKSPKEVFLKKGNDDEFYVRQGPLSKQLFGSDLLRYVEGNFR